TENLLQNPDQFTEHHTMGLAHLYQEEYEQAVACFDKAIRLQDRAGEMYNARGTAYRLLKKFDKAIADHSHALELQPKDFQAHCERGQAYREKGQYAKAVADQRKALKLLPTHISAQMELAWIRATCPSVKHRNAEQALGHAVAACRLTGWRDPEC